MTSSFCKVPTNPEFNYLIRSAHADELPRLIEIEKAALNLFKQTEHFALADNPTPDPMMYLRFLDKGAIFVAVDSEDNIVGFALTEEVGCQGFLNEIYVHPAHGRQGLGRRLVDAVKIWCDMRGYNEVRLTTFVNVAWNAPYYARLGFQPLKEDELSPELLDVRRDEATTWGVDITRTVFMTLVIRQNIMSIITKDRQKDSQKIVIFSVLS
ncbi:MAG: GNAT family N-acetyltransferase [Alphaproteobacteria bacterium]|nr:GNAT family N-acetyltransferase [Alphaproteobacteria bacterium]